MTPHIIARDVLLELSPDADRYGVHAALDARWGRRGEVGYLWSIGRIAGGRAARARLPPDHPDGAAGLPVMAPVEGERFGFRLASNITQKDSATGKRRSWARDDVAPRLRWFERRAAEHGFRVEQVQAEVARCFIRKGRGFWIDETIFTGILVVTNEQAFAAALAGGVGQRGAFGFGLLETFDPSTLTEAT
ncbi:type I-E CRISPR-associated protein Cas6/Cse3/CasE [Falsiroseomonas sp. HW251]|uniref:type I-E CRISPR-associated protein Cas6/Cse3/CasE n=1 Tax=Falsiroseomonas sp. HW251 TaxID=3390998 RepID=UPI003D31FB69